MSTDGFPMPPGIARFQRFALAVGMVALAVSLVGAAISPDQFFRSYLIGYLFWMGLATGCLAILMLQHLTGGGWGLVSRRILEAGSRTLPLGVVLFLPIVAGLRRIFVWAVPETVAQDSILQHKSLFLNVPFFIGRAFFYFAVWLLLMHFLNKWSLEQDRSGDPRLGGRLEALSAPGLVLFGLTVTFASFDWAMSLDPHWFSTIYGVLFMGGQVLSAMALVIVTIGLLVHEKPLSEAVSRDQVHDLGKLMLAFVSLWAYFSVSQLIIVWSGNLPEEIPWYLNRLGRGWQYLALGLVLFHFVLPFVVLLSRDLKRNARLLARVAGGMLIMRFVDMFWLIGPEFHADGFTVHWLDLTASVGLGGIWLWRFTGELGKRPLLPIGDPALKELMVNGHE